MPAVRLPRQGISVAVFSKGGHWLARTPAPCWDSDLGPQTASLGFSIAVPCRPPHLTKVLATILVPRRRWNRSGPMWDGTDSAARMESGAGR